MRRFIFLFCIIAALAGPFAALALAETRDFGAYTADVPEGWAVERSKGLDIFSAPDGEQKYSLSMQKVGKDAGLTALAREAVGETPVTMLEGGKDFLYEDASGARGWYMLTDDGTFVGLEVGSPRDDAGYFIFELAAAEDQPALQQAFQTAKGEDAVIQWLRGFALPLKGDVPSWWGDYRGGQKNLFINNFRAGPVGYYFAFSFESGKKRVEDLAVLDEDDARRATALDGRLVFTISKDDNSVTVALDAEEKAGPEALKAGDFLGTYTRR